MKFPLYELMIDDDAALGIDKVSLVSSPAVEIDFQCFDKDVPLKQCFSTDDEKRRVFGCVLRADFPIYRRNGDYEYFIKFSKDTIQKIAEKMLADNNQNRINLEHNWDTRDVHMTQVFIKNIDRGISPKGFDDVEDGSLFAEYQILSDNLWEDIKNGEFKGFSVEIVSNAVPVGEVEAFSKQPTMEEMAKDCMGMIDTLFKTLQ